MTQKTRRTVKKSSAKRQAKKSELFAKVVSEIWPLERDILFRPDRLKYVRKLVKQEGWVFCRAAKEKP